MSGEPVGQEGRLQAVRSLERADSRHERQRDLLTADLRRLAEAAVPAAQRLSRAEGHPQLRRTQRKANGLEQVVFSHRSTGNNPQEVDHR